ncbi:MAG: RNA 2',3'-cyclic phosphodiesterase [Desulfatitalea sp.]
MRAFIAFELPPEITRLAADLQAHLKRQGLKLRWVRPGNIHLTLRFLGEIPSAQTAAVAQAMRTAAQGGAPAQLSVQGMGVFPGLRKPRVVWIGLGGQTDGLGQTAVRLEAELALLGLPREERPFKAHLTLARIQTPVEARLLQGAIEVCGAFAPQPFLAAEMVLFQSDLRPQGPIYTSLARATLGE